MLLLDQNNVKIFLSSIVGWLMFSTVANFSRTMPEFICSDVRKAFKLAISDKWKLLKMRRETDFLRILYGENNYVTF